MAVAPSLGPAASADELRPLGHARLDVAPDPLQLGLGDERAHVGVVDATTQPGARHQSPDAVRHVGGDASRHEDARAGATGLARVVDDTAHR